MSGDGTPLARPLLSPPAVLYAGIVRLRNRLFDSGILRTGSLPVPVISVGNITAGGTGKTPLVAELARHLTASGRRVAILSRGYGGSLRGPFVLSSGDGSGSPSADATEAGDEPVLLSMHLPDVAVVIGADRRKSGRVAVERLGARVILLDDGFQHRWLRRDLDVLVLEAREPFGRYRLLPSGFLREPVSSIRRAGMVVITNSHPDDPLQTLGEIIRRHCPEAPVFRAYHTPSGFIPSGGGGEIPPPEMSGRSAVAFCGIGNPAGFRATLEQVGLKIIRFVAFRDHHVFSRDEVDGLFTEARETGASLLVTTEKDAVRLPLLPDARPPLFALRIRCRVDPEREFFERIDRAVSAAAGQ